jgi:ferrochelatase
MGRQRVAIVLFNLGGPDRPESVKPFLLNQFTDPAILRVPFYIRPLLARIIARARVRPASANYALLGGKSPLLELTQAQAGALEAEMTDIDARCFVAMRYWHPFSIQAAREVKAWDPDEVVLLPLYPHYSTTTTGSSLTAWREAAAKVGLVKPTMTLCCYHTDPMFVSATARIVGRCFNSAQAALAGKHPLRVLFSAHGLPEKIILEGDPYQHQVEQTVAAVTAELGLPGLDSVVCYQSRATPQKWIGPSTEEELERAAHDRCAVLVVPIAFVSEHSETLVELDVEYRGVAERIGVPGYFRAPTQNSDPAFIACLAELVRRTRRSGTGLSSFDSRRLCPAACTACPCHMSARLVQPRTLEPVA